MSLAWFLPLSDGYGWVDVDGVYNFACSLREVLAKHPFLPHGCGLVSGSYFPSFSEGLSLRRNKVAAVVVVPEAFPFLFGGAFIEACRDDRPLRIRPEFPFLFGGAFIEASFWREHCPHRASFPFLFGGAFIEAFLIVGGLTSRRISLPFRRGFH